MENSNHQNSKTAGLKTNSFLPTLGPLLAAPISPLFATAADGGCFQTSLNPALHGRNYSPLAETAAGEEENGSALSKHSIQSLVNPIASAEEGSEKSKSMVDPFYEPLFEGNFHGTGGLVGVGVGGVGNNHLNSNQGVVMENGGIEDIWNRQFPGMRMDSTSFNTPNPFDISDFSPNNFSSSSSNNITQQPDNGNNGNYSSNRGVSGFSSMLSAAPLPFISNGANVASSGPLQSHQYLHQQRPHLGSGGNQTPLESPGTILNSLLTGGQQSNPTTPNQLFNFPSGSAGAYPLTFGSDGNIISPRQFLGSASNSGASTPSRSLAPSPSASAFPYNSTSQFNPTTPDMGGGGHGYYSSLQYPFPSAKRNLYSNGRASMGMVARNDGAVSSNSDAIQSLYGNSINLNGQNMSYSASAPSGHPPHYQQQLLQQQQQQHVFYQPSQSMNQNAPLTNPYAFQKAGNSTSYQLHQQKQQQRQSQAQSLSASSSMDSGKNDRMRKKKNCPRVSKENRICSDCGTRDTPIWRYSEDGDLLCNACGVYAKKNKQKRSVDKLKRKRGNNSNKNDASSHAHFEESEPSFFSVASASSSGAPY